MMRLLRDIACAATLTLVLMVGLVAPESNAEPPATEDLIVPLPVFVPQPSSWEPKFPYPYDQTRNRITQADITAMSEMCQWFNAQYMTLRNQIRRLQFNRIDDNGTDWNYAVNGVQEQVDVVTGNIDKALDFLTPRVQSLTQSTDFAGDVYFPIYKGDAFYALWQQLFNVNNGIKAHQPGWFTGPSQLRAEKWGSEIHRSHVCEQ